MLALNTEGHEDHRFWDQTGIADHPLWPSVYSRIPAPVAQNTPVVAEEYSES